MKLEFQYLLSSKNGKEKLIQKGKESKNISEESMKKFFPFIFSYKPKQVLSQNLVFEEIIAGDTKPFRYTFSDIFDAFTDYTINDEYKYYTNLTEISARNAEYLYWHDVIKGKLPKPEGISEKFLKNATANCLRKTGLGTSL